MPFPFTCPHCRRQTMVPDQYLGQSGPCAGCGAVVTVVPPGSPMQPIEDNAAIRMLIPVGRSGWAIAAGYAGLCSVIPFVAPLAILFAVLAIRDIKKHPKKHGMGRAIFGLVIGILFTLILCVAIIPAMMHGFR
jgi:hypothetical protein